MSLTLALNNALSGLAVNQATLATISNNIANANTVGYSRQVVDQSARILDGVGAGVQIDAVSRKIDKYLEQAIQKETGNVGSAAVVSDYYDRMQILLGEPGSTNSIDEYVEDFFNALQALAETADRTSFQSNAVDTGENLAREISGLALALEDLRYQADQDIKNAVNFLNSEIEHLDAINIALNRAAALGTASAGLLDERDMALKNISEYMDISYTEQASGAVYVFAANGFSLVDESIHELRYKPASGVNAFINNEAVTPLYIYTLDEDGTEIGEPNILIGSGVEDGVVSKLKSGTLSGLQELRDNLIPEVISQLDMLASRLRDQINAIHNDGSGFPGADELSGTRLVGADQAFDWTGQVRIAVLNSDGTPATSTYADEGYTGYRPLTLDFDFLDSGLGNGAGVPTTQTIIDEINNHFNAPPVKAELNNLNNIQLVSNNIRVPTGAPPTFSFDFDLENISGNNAQFFVTGVTVLDDLAANITSSTDTLPKVALNAAGAYDFYAGESRVGVNTTAPHQLQVGDWVYLGDSGAMPAFFASGVASTEMVDYFQVTAVTGANSFEVEINSAATATTVGEAIGAPADVVPKYFEVEAGDKARSRDEGLVTVDFSGNAVSAYYDVTVDVAVVNEDGTIEQATLTYRIQNNETNRYNARYDISSVTGAAERVFPNTPHQYIFARLVDANGNELPKVNGSYGSQQGYLQLVANDLGGEEYTIHIDELNSQQQGVLTTIPVQKGTNRGFSHYYELNNFFVSNNPTATGDSVDGSAISMAVEQRILDNPSLITTGDLTLSNQSVDPNDPPVYTYERYAGDNSVAQRLAGLGVNSISFDAVGGLPKTNLTFNGFAGEMLGYIASKSAQATARLTDNETLLQGFEQRADAISGVNLDEELANTVIYQNAYTASARVVTVTNDLFDELLNMI